MNLVVSKHSTIGNRQSAIGNALVECVPNFSEGRKIETVERLAKVIDSVTAPAFWTLTYDPDHNRSVITFVADPNAVVEAALRAVALAAELIDMRAHIGAHPRLGATDVLPFVPVRGVTMEECVALAHEAGERIAKNSQFRFSFMNERLANLIASNLKMSDAGLSSCFVNK